MSLNLGKYKGFPNLVLSWGKEMFNWIGLDFRSNKCNFLIKKKKIVTSFFKKRHDIALLDI